MVGVRSGQFCLNLAITNGVLCFIHKYNIFLYVYWICKGDSRICAHATCVSMSLLYSIDYSDHDYLFGMHVNYWIFLWSLFLIFNFKNDFFLPEHFECVLQVLYNVVYIKAIAATSCTFTSEEREAWRKKGRHVCTDSL